MGKLQHSILIEPHTSPHAPSFSALGIAPLLLEILDKQSFTTPTPIQQQSIPPALEGKDIVGIAQTGTGKTMAFGIPMMQHLAQGKGRGLIVVPTRELAYQVEQSLRMFSGPLRIPIAVLIGGASMRLQKDMIRRNPRIVVATPGRLNDHLTQRTITLKEVSVLVFDEADRMFDMGFRPQIDQILKQVPRERQTMLFSATMPAEIMKLANSEMKLPLRIEVAPAGTTAAAIQQELFIVQKSEKLSLLEKVLGEHKGAVLVFSRTKHGAKKLATAIRSMQHTAAEIHANRSLGQRKEALEGFKRGKYRILVATDIAARGIDVANIELVINYDLPDDANDYVHRIGRTARAGREGKAISFATGDQRKSIRDIERLIRITLPMKNAEGLEQKSLPYTEGEHQGRPPFRRNKTSWRKQNSGRGSRRPRR